MLDYTDEELDAAIERAVPLLNEHHLNSHANYYKFKARSGDYEVFPEYYKATLNRVDTGPCHGDVSNGKPDVIISSLKKAYNYGHNVDADVDKYYAEIMPYFENLLLRPFKAGDRHIVVDAHAPGNWSLFCLITSRQPWESETMLDKYLKFRETYSPMVALYAAYFYKGSSEPRSFSGEHDGLLYKLNPAMFAEFIANGTLFHPEDSLYEGNRLGVHKLFDELYYADHALLNRCNGNSLPYGGRRTSKTVKGKLIHKVIIPVDNTIEFKTDFESYLIDNGMPKELVYA